MHLGNQFPALSSDNHFSYSCARRVSQCWAISPAGSSPTIAANPKTAGFRHDPTTTLTYSNVLIGRLFFVVSALGKNRPGY